MAYNQEVSSLLDLCIRKIVHDHTSTKTALHCIPREIFQPFLLSAVTHKRDLCIKEIVARWPHRVLSLKSLIPEISVGHECGPCRRQRDLPTNQTASLCHFIVDGFMQNDGKLQLLDITGFGYSPLKPNEGYSAIRILQLIEAKQRLKNTDRLGVTHTLHMDWFLTNDDCREVIRCVTSLSPTVSVKCKSLAFGELSPKLMREVASILDPQIIDALNLSMQNVVYIRLIRLFPHMEYLVSLTSLDLSYCQHDGSNPLHTNYYPMSIIAKGFGKLPCLTQLRLNGNHLGGMLHSLLKDIRKSLLVLDLHSCMLDRSDIAYLANSHHASHLKDLNLGQNNLSNDPQSLFKLLTSSSGSLVHLALDTLIPSIAIKLVQLSYKMKKLRTLTIGRNLLKAEDLATIVTSYALNVPTLVTIKIPLYSDMDTGISNCMVVYPRLPKWDSGNYTGDQELVTFLEICIHMFRERNPSNDHNELHVLMEEECCCLFKF